MRPVRFTPLILCAALAQAVPRVTSPNGDFVGNSSIPQLDQFLGIPYAEPPVGNLRFSNPKPFPSEPGHVFNATSYGPGCSQLDIYEEYNGLGEDCLTLNVIRPSIIKKHSLLPVLFFIHGGAHLNGQSIFYNGTALVQHSISSHNPIIYVGVNYRLGGFGFLNSPDFLSAGITNLGLKDQYLALQWVHENIKSFGGDPETVTIFGESSGAADCWAHLHYAFVRNESGKYFGGMITQSGAPGSPAFPIALNAEDGASDYAQLLEQTNCTGPQSVDCLRKVPHDVIAPLLVNETEIVYTIDDDWFDANLTYLVETSQFAHLPIIHGSNLDEGSVFMPDPFGFPNRSALVGTVAGYLGNDTESATDIVDKYFATSLAELGKGVNADPTAPDGYWAATAVYTDILMDLGKRTLLDIASERADTWAYSFRQQPPLGSLNLSYEYPGVSVEYAARVGVYHGAELPYVFGEATSLAQHTQGDVDVAIAVMNAWISFAYSLSPNNHDDSDAVFWPKYSSSGSRALMIFEEQGGLSMRVSPYTTRAAVFKAWGAALREIGQDPPF